jgi:hypothetical protein
MAPRHVPAPLAALLASLAVALPVTALSATQEQIDLARRRGDETQELFQRARRFVAGWLTHRDPASGLIPQNLSSPLWTPENSAADNYPFMVITSYLSDPGLLAGTMTDILHSEIRLTTRVGAMPDTFSFPLQGFERATVDWPRLVFGSAEYCKDGLLPVAELMGRTEWFSRLRGMAASVCDTARVETRFGPIPDSGAEVNGEFMEVLARLHPATGDARFLEMALRIGDAYFLEVLPRNNYLPCHTWDFATHKPANPVLRLIDHGSEIVGGLSEVYVLASRYAPDKAKQYAEPMRRMVDALLTHCLNPDGLWYINIDTQALKGSGGVPDTWGYVFNGVYTYGMMTGDPRCREATERAMKAICKLSDWGSADQFADTIESAVVLLNRIDVPETWEWVDRMTATMSAIQRPDGIIEGWHGDGNVARTWMMVALAKTGGIHAVPWRPDLKLGAVPAEGGLLVSLRAEQPWSGRLCFDYPRHRDHLNLEPNYPRLNEFPEWNPVDDGSLYAVSRDGTGVPDAVDGGVLRLGLPVEMPAGGEWLATVRLVGPPPHGVSQVGIRGPKWHAGAGETEVLLFVRNAAAAPAEVDLSSDWGTVDPSHMSLAGHGRAAAALRGTLTDDRNVTVIARTGPGAPSVTHTVQLLRGEGLTDYQDLSGSNVYEGEDYWWLNDGDLDLKLKVERGKAHIVSFYWGCKNDVRSCKMTTAGEQQTLTQNGYQGFRWYDVEVLASEVTGSTLGVRLSKPDSGPVSFLGRVKVRSKP